MLGAVSITEGARECVYELGTGWYVLGAGDGGLLVLYTGKSGFLTGFLGERRDMNRAFSGDFFDFGVHEVTGGGSRTSSEQRSRLTIAASAACCFPASGGSVVLPTFAVTLSRKVSEEEIQEDTLGVQ